MVPSSVVTRAQNAEQAEMLETGRLLNINEEVTSFYALADKGGAASENVRRDSRAIRERNLRSALRPDQLCCPDCRLALVQRRMWHSECMRYQRMLRGALASHIGDGGRTDQKSGGRVVGTANGSS